MLSFHGFGFLEVPQELRPEWRLLRASGLAHGLPGGASPGLGLAFGLSDFLAVGCLGLVVNKVGVDGSRAPGRGT